MTVKQQLVQKIEAAVLSAWPDLSREAVRPEVMYPPDGTFGDYSSSMAMKLASALRQNPMAIAEQLKHALGPVPMFEEIRVVAPGYLNFFLSQPWLERQVPQILAEKQRFGRVDLGKGKRVVVEYVSANPTGPVTMANGRGAFAGDTLARIFKLAGYAARREYYINDVGNQVAILAESVLRRYWISHGIKMEYPDYCYQGEYVTELARRINLPNYTLSNVEKVQEVRDKIKGRILEKMLKDIKRLLGERLGVKYDVWFSEKTLYTSGQVDQTLALLKERKLLYKSEGAIWLKMKDHGESQDHVLIKADGNSTYFLSEIAYLVNKFVKRKYHRYVWLIGADHHGHAQRIQTIHRMLGLPGTITVILMQFVRLMQEGREVKMSKRAGTFVTLEELVDEVGVDAARYFFLMHDFNSHMDFDLDLAKKQTKDNPVYYVQYAHARICSILKKARRLAVVRTDRSAPEPSELQLMKELVKWPEIVADVAESCQVHRLPLYATTLATKFHDFYTRCRVISDNTVDQQRMQLLRATQLVLQSVLATMGISAPDQM